MTKHQCPECAYTYDASIGDEYEGYLPGTLFKDLPDDFFCPDCSVRFKIDFIEVDSI
ncbi:rubredoxin [Woeseiaceae bacterium]|jgi:rubredoxin|nr:rubredoxin [Woeseiaceae bacterium]|tara:strand:+ start:124 stop:294 length:171 start_codon:yes stop_codon:yes gene_type:complete